MPTNAKFEIRNSKQIQMTKEDKIQCKLDSVSFGNLDLSIFDLFRISSFGFRILIAWSLLEAIYFVELVLFQI
jgi:hypothetical protein